MDTMQAIIKRRSIRKFTQEKVQRSSLETIIKAASYSPSWANTQIVRYTIIDDPCQLDHIANHAFKAFNHNSRIVAEAPGLLVMTMVKGKCGRNGQGQLITDKKDAWEMFDAGIASQSFSLAAHAHGLGSVILGIFDTDTIAKAIDLDANETIAALIAFGYAKEPAKTPPRKPLEDILKFI